LLAALSVGFFVAFAIGANDETMTPAVGSGLLPLSVAVFIGGILNFFGAFLLGEGVSKTVGQNLSHQILTLDMVFIILITMAVWLLLVSFRGIPISTTQSIVGAVVGVALVEWGLTAINFSSLVWVVLSWVVSPLVGLIGGFCFYWVIMRIRAHLKTRGYGDYERQEKIAMWFLAIFLLISVFSRSGNDVAKAIGPLMAIPDFSIFPLPALVAGGLGMCLGVIFLGRRVVKKLSKGIVALSPTSALAASISVSLIMLVGTFLGIPLSGSHILVCAFIGVGLVNRETVDRGPLKEIGVSWVVTTPISALLAGAAFFVMKSITALVSYLLSNGPLGH